MRWSRGAAHQHQKDGDQLPGSLRRVRSTELKPRCGGDRLKGGGVEPLPAGEFRPLGQAELIALEKQKGEEQQGGGGNQDQLALQAVGPEPETVLPEVVPGEKAQTAHEDEQRDGPQTSGSPT